MTWKVIEGGPRIITKQINALGDKLLQIFPLAKAEGRAHHFLIEVEGEIPEGIFHDVTDNLVLPGGNLSTDDVLVDCSKYLTEIDNLKAECKTKTAKIKELQDELANCLNAEAAAKKECSEAKKQLDVYIKENVKLGKDLEKRDDAIGKLKEDLAKVKSALKALE